MIAELLLRWREQSFAGKAFKPQLIELLGTTGSRASSDCDASNLRKRVIEVNGLVPWLRFPCAFV